MKKISYEELQSDYSTENCTFSIFKSNDSSPDDKIWYVDISDEVARNSVIIKGRVVFRSDYWRVVDGLGVDSVSSKKTYTDPRYSDLAEAAEEFCAAGKTSLFLEGFSVVGTRKDGTVVCEIEFGS